MIDAIATLIQFVINIEHLSARVAEHRMATLLDQGLHNDPCTCHFFHIIFVPFCISNRLSLSVSSVLRKNKKNDRKPHTICVSVFSHPQLTVCLCKHTVDGADQGMNGRYNNVAVHANTPGDVTCFIFDGNI